MIKRLYRVICRYMQSHASANFIPCGLMPYMTFNAMTGLLPPLHLRRIGAGFPIFRHVLVTPSAPLKFNDSAKLCKKL